MTTYSKGTCTLSNKKTHLNNMQLKYSILPEVLKHASVLFVLLILNGFSSDACLYSLF